MTKRICVGIREALGCYGCELEVAAENYDDLKERQERLDAVWEWVSYAEERLEAQALQRRGVRV